MTQYRYRTLTMDRDMIYLLSCVNSMESEKGVFTWIYRVSNPGAAVFTRIVIYSVYPIRSRALASVSYVHNVYYVVLRV